MTAPFRAGMKVRDALAATLNDFRVVSMSENRGVVRIELDLRGSSPSFRILACVSIILRTTDIDLDFDRSEFGTDVTPMSQSIVTLTCTGAAPLDSVMT